MKKNTITIDMADFCKHMISYGITREQIVNDNDFDGWTDAIVDVLEDKYEFETKLVKEFKNGSKR